MLGTEDMSVVTSAAFKDEWLGEIIDGAPSTVEKGRRFAWKLLNQWLDLDLTEEPVYCDGANDGGIDLAVLVKADADQATIETVGDTWYLIQSKYGSAFAGTSTLLAEGQKVIDTLDGRRQKLSSLADGLLDRLTTFRQSSSDNDKIILVFATIEPLSEVEKRVLSDLRAMGRQRLGANFDVISISLETIYQRVQPEITAANQLSVELVGQMASSGDDLLIGAVSLVDLYSFLKRYRDATEDLDQLYEKNVRRFLGAGGRVNKAMQATLLEAPERFGLYNNGITIVTEDFKAKEGAYDLIEPYVVNGCQTTRTIWEVFYRKFEAGGTGQNLELEAWKERARKGVVVAKVVKVGIAGETLLQAITRFTNSQNPVREKDFITLTSDFKFWAGGLAEKYGLFLEVQRGAWESRKALQKQKPELHQFTQAVNAFDLLKVYGAGWLGEPGMAYGRNAAFLPNGAVYKRVIDAPDEDSFGVDDLYAAYLLHQAANDFTFGRGAIKDSRRQSRFLFYWITVELLKDMVRQMGKFKGRRSISEGLIKVLGSQNAESGKALLQPAVTLVDSYLTHGGDNTAFNEPVFINAFNSNLNNFLKWERIGKTDEDTPKLRNAISIARASMAYGDNPPIKAIEAALSTS